MENQSQTGRAGLRLNVSPSTHLRLFWPAVVATVVAIYWSPMWQETLHFQAISFPMASFMPAFAALLVTGLSAMTLVQSVRIELSTRRFSGATLLALAVAVSLIFSVIVQVNQSAFHAMKGQDFWWQLCAMLMVAHLGRWTELTAQLTTTQGFAPVLASVAGASDLELGDIITVRAGETMPVDGKIIQGEALVNESMFTGGVTPVSKTSGDYVFAGSVNATVPTSAANITINDLLKIDSDDDVGSIQIQVAALGEQTLISSIVELEKQAEAQTSRTQSLTEQFGLVLFGLVIIGAGVTGLAWSTTNHEPMAFVIEKVVAVLAAGAPAALYLAAPMVSAFAITNAARSGVLVHNRTAFERLAKRGLFMVDKTGILTTGDRTYADSQITRRGGLESTDELLAVAAGLEFGIDHAVARAILNETYKRGIIPIGVKDVMTVPGIGVSGRWEEHRLWVGGPGMLTRQKIDIDVQDLYRVDALNSQGKTVIYVARDAILLGYIALDDEVKDGSGDAVWDLQNQGYRVGLITGDAHGVASAVAAKLGIEDIVAEVLPQEKADKIAQLKEQGKVVTLAGNEESDQAALSLADVSISYSTRETLATAKADLVLVTNQPESLALTTNLARHAKAKTNSAIAWAVGYNLVALPLAAGALALIGTVFIPAVAVAMSSFAGVIVALNAQGLGGKR